MHTDTIQSLLQLIDNQNILVMDTFNEWKDICEDAFVDALIEALCSEEAYTLDE